MQESQFSPLLKCLDKDQALRARQTLNGHAYNLFEVMVIVLNTRACARRLYCMRRPDVMQRKNRIALYKRFRQTFAVCWGWLNLKERGSLRQEMEIYLFRREADNSLSEEHSDSGQAPALHSDIMQSERHDQMLTLYGADIRESDEFKNWRKESRGGKLQPFRLFRKLVSPDLKPSPDEFLDMWAELSSVSQGRLLSVWHKLATCGCTQLTPAGKKLQVRLTPDSDVRFI